MEPADEKYSSFMTTRTYGHGTGSGFGMSAFDIVQHWVKKTFNDIDSSKVLIEKFGKKFIRNSSDLSLRQNIQISR